MAVKLLFQGIPQFEDSSGNPYTSARLFFYAAGSSTKQNTYSDSAGSTPNDNPITLNSSGYPAVSGNIVQIWGTTGQTYKIGLAAPGSDDPPASFIWSADNVSPINDTTVTIDQWVTGPTPTYVSATSFTLSGDQTSTFHIGRRLKTTNSGGTIYSTITNAVFGALTTITVANDSGTLDSGLSAVSYGLITAVNPSISSEMIYRKGSAVASAATCNIWNTQGDYIHITGSTGPITSFGTAPYAGARKEIIFDSTPTITHDATSLQIPGGLSVTVAAGDRMVIRADTTANMVVMQYTRVSGSGAVTPLPRAYLAGCTISNNSGDATNDIDFAAGVRRDSTDTVNITCAAMTKRLDANWSAGTGNGMRNSGAAITDTTYHLYAVSKADGTQDYYAHTSTNVATVITALQAESGGSAYLYARRVASILREGGTIVPFSQVGDRFERTTLADENTNWAALSTVAGNYACSVPLGLSVLVLLQAFVSRSTGAEGLFVYKTTQTDETPDVASNAIANMGFTFNTGAGMTAGRMSAALEVMTNTSAQVRARAVVGLTAFDIRSRGWIDSRGRDE